MSSIFTNRQNTANQWIWPVSAMCLVLGFMCSLAWVTEDNRQSRIRLLPADQSRRLTEGAIDIDSYQELTTEVSKLRDEKTKLENALAGTNSQTKALNDGLQDAKIFACLTDLEGPGVVVSLRDSPRTGTGMAGDVSVSPDAVIHDTDVLRVVNELFNASAEAVAVNEHRISPRSSIRCVGSTVLINDVKISSPIEIRAIGDPATIMGAMNMPGGVLHEIRTSDPAMVSIEKAARMTVKAYAGPTEVRFSKVPVPKK